MKAVRKRRRGYGTGYRRQRRTLALRWIMAQRGIGHFIGIALGVSATLMFFNMVYPVASSMFQSSITTMQTINSGILNGTLKGS